IPSLAQCAANTINCNFSAFSAAAANSIGDRVSYASEDPWIARTIIKGLTNTTTIRLGDNHQLKNIFAIRTTDVFTNTSLTGTPLAIVDTASATKLKQTTEEIQLSGSFLDNDLKYTVGGFFYNEKPNGTAGFSALEINAFFGLSHSLTTTYLHNSSKAVYGQIDYSLDKLIPGLSLTAGLRQTWDTQSACTVSQAISPFAPTPMLIVTPEDVDTYVPSEDACTSATGLAGAAIGASAQTFPDAKFKKLTYTLGANYQVTPDALVYLAHRRGYRAGGYNTPLLDPYLSAEQTFQPETLTDWELGLKARAQLGSVRATLDLAVYSGKDTANQLPLNTSNLAAGVCIVDALGTPGHPTSDCAVGGTPGSLVYVIGATNIVNGATLTIRGVEASGTLSPFRGLTFTGALSYNDITVDSIQVGDRFQNFLNAAGLPAVFSIQGQPKWTSNAGVLVDVPGEILGGKLSASFDYHYTGALTSVALTVPSFHQMDLRFNLNDIGGTGVSAAAWVKNLTNETIYAGTSSSSPTAGAYSFIIGAPRTVGMSLSYKFGAR
ncbi:MAG: TonB-dependent receptor, partial [Alphaproteobacteria bacterium]|nr:TonB-dependent receptor [Alphaproteobacteria bacterium]